MYGLAAATAFSMSLRHMQAHYHALLRAHMSTLRGQAYRSDQAITATIPCEQMAAEQHRGMRSSAST